MNTGKIQEQKSLSSVPMGIKKILIIAPGSYGDVRPYVSLSSTLMDRGHYITIASEEMHKEFISNHGIIFHNIRGNLFEPGKKRKKKNFKGS